MTKCTERQSVTESFFLGIPQTQYSPFTSHHSTNNPGVIRRFSWLYWISMKHQMARTLLNWKRPRLVATPLLRNHTPAAFKDQPNRFVCGFDGSFPNKAQAIHSQQMLFKSTRHQRAPKDSDTASLVNHCRNRGPDNKLLSGPCGLTN
jgi:hypothetical protein